MDTIEKNHVHLLSHIIYTIYSVKDLNEMRREVLELLRYAIPFDTANFFLVAKDHNNQYMLTDLVNINTLETSEEDLDSILKRYMEECAMIDSTHWVCNTKTSFTYRTTDFFSESFLKNTEYYKEMFSPYNVHFGVQVVLAHNNTCVGLLTLFRAKTSPDFTDVDVFFLDNIKEHLALRLYASIHEHSTVVYNTSSLKDQYGLTQREAEILNLLFAGLTNEKISKELFISENTLRRHLYNLYHKMGITHRWELFFLER